MPRHDLTMADVNQLNSLAAVLEGPLNAPRTVEFLRGLATRIRHQIEAPDGREQLANTLRNARAYLDANRLQGFAETSSEGGGVYEDSEGEYVRREAVQAMIEEFMVGVAAALATTGA